MRASWEAALDSVAHTALCIVLPMRGIASGKSRLAHVLSLSERERLNEWLLVRTLDTLRAWRGNLRQCVVVSACERVLDTAHTAGACALRESTHGELNAALTQATAHALHLGARRVLVVPCDLPGLVPHALSSFVDHAANADVGIAPDQRGSGTNALIVDAAHPLEFHFGPQSFGLHMRVAAARSSSVVVHRSCELALDLDTPVDLERWRSSAGFGGAAAAQEPVIAMV